MKRKVLFYIILAILFITSVGLGYIDYKHISNDYKLELKIQKINNKNVEILKKINTFCVEFDNKGVKK